VRSYWAVRSLTTLDSPREEFHHGDVQSKIQAALRKLTQVTRPLAMRSAGKVGSNTAIVRHVGRRSGHPYETPVVAVRHEDSFFIALPYDERTDWMKNVLAGGGAEIVSSGSVYVVDHPQVVPMTEVTGYFRTKEQRMHRRFGVESALRLHYG
jgi:deazaflavin-dependent oxidoreductase (nitroreductase family)